MAICVTLQHLYQYLWPRYIIIITDILKLIKHFFFALHNFQWNAKGIMTNNKVKGIICMNRT